MHFGAFERSGYERAVPIDSIGLACLFVVGVLCKPLVKFSLVVEKALFRVTPRMPTAATSMDGRVRTSTFSDDFTFFERSLGPTKKRILPGLISASTGVVIATSF